MTTIKWHGDAVLKETQKLAWKRVLAAGAYLKARIQENVSIPTVMSGPSKPGEYPHIGYHPPTPGGTLRKSIFVRKREDMVAVDVGTALIYGVHWELTNRPYIRRTYAEKLGEIKAILEGKLVRTIEDVKAEAAAMKERHAVQKAAIQEKKAAKKESARIEKFRIKTERAARKAEQRSMKKAYARTRKRWAREAKAARLKERLAKMTKEERQRYKAASAARRKIAARPEEKAYARTKKRWAREAKQARKEIRAIEKERKNRKD